MQATIHLKPKEEKSKFIEISEKECFMIEMIDFYQGRRASANEQKKNEKN